MEKGYKQKTKKIMGGLAFASLTAGFVLLNFVNKGATGNVIINNNPSFDVFPLIGLLFVLLSAVLAFIAIKE